MTIDLRWIDEEHSGFIFEYLGTWTWNELYQASQTAVAWGTGRQNVPSIHDLSQSHTFPEDALFHGRHLSFGLPDNPIMVIVGANPFVLAMIDLLRRLSRSIERQYFTAASVDEAIALIKNEQASVK